MKISDITIKTFRTTADRWDVGHARPMPDTELMQTVLTIHTDEGVDGHYFGGGSHGDAEGLNVVDQQAILWRIKDLLVGQDPIDREMIWKWLWVANVQENVASVIDNALWDLAGRYAKLPVYKLMGGARDKVKAYASTYPEHRQAAGLCRARAGLQERGLPRLQDPPALFLEPRDRHADAGPSLQHQGRHRDHPPGARGGRAGLRADVRPLGHVHEPRGGDQGRARAREAQLLLVRAPDAGIPGRELRAALPRADDPDPVARDRRRRRVHRGPSGSCAAPAT